MTRKRIGPNRSSVGNHLYPGVRVSFTPWADPNLYGDNVGKVTSVTKHRVKVRGGRTGRPYSLLAADVVRL